MENIDIIIPTFNRAPYLLKNLQRLADIEQTINVKLRIFISDNASTDNTVSCLSKFMHTHSESQIYYYRQEKNIGFCKNLIYLLSKSSAEFLLVLGDDDYIDYRYLEKAIDALNGDNDIKCILPSFEAISENGHKLGFGRDLGLKMSLFEKGINSAVVNSPRAHQLSGIIVRRESLYDIILKKGISNLYPQIFLVAYSCLNGKCLHIPEWPVYVTQTPNKAWSYDDTGLLRDIFENISKLDISDYSRYLIERSFIKTQSWRFLRYRKQPLKQIKVICLISFDKNTSITGRFLFPFLLTWSWAKCSFTKLKNIGQI